MHLKNAIHANTYIRGYPMLILYIADVERDVGMKKLSQKEAAKVLEDMKVKIEIPKAAVTQWKRNAALDMAIEALKYSEIPNSSDTISRQAAIDALDVLCQEHRYKIPGKAETYSQYNEAWQDALDRAEGAIFNLPPVQPKRGKWIKKHWKAFRCSECNRISEYSTNFCPNCGADMRGNEDGTD